MRKLALMASNLGLNVGGSWSLQGYGVERYSYISLSSSRDYMYIIIRLRNILLNTLGGSPIPCISLLSPE